MHVADELDGVATKGLLELGSFGATHTVDRPLGGWVGWMAGAGVGSCATCHWCCGGVGSGHKLLVSHNELQLLEACAEVVSEDGLGMHDDGGLGGLGGLGEHTDSVRCTSGGAVEQGGGWGFALGDEMPVILVLCCSIHI